MCTRNRKCKFLVFQRGAEGRSTREALSRREQGICKKLKQGSTRDTTTAVSNKETILQCKHTPGMTSTSSCQITSIIQKMMLAGLWGLASSTTLTTRGLNTKKCKLRELRVDVRKIEKIYKRLGTLRSAYKQCLLQVALSTTNPSSNHITPGPLLLPLREARASSGFQFERC